MFLVYFMVCVTRTVSASERASERERDRDRDRDRDRERDASANLLREDKITTSQKLPVSMFLKQYNQMDLFPLLFTFISADPSVTKETLTIGCTVIIFVTPGTHRRRDARADQL